jgi:undecaprenyl diphosphate synthase
VDAVKSIVSEGIPASKVDERTVRRHLYAPDLPDPDLVIRTSGEYRISNFLLWELAYSELVFSNVLWPDFRREHLAEAVREYQARERRYGSAAGQRDNGIP